MKGKFCLLLFILCCSAVFGQQKVLSIQHFNEDDGFSESLVSYAIQDSIGYIWMSTWDGLYRYDGYRFINYKARPGDNCPQSPSAYRLLQRMNLLHYTRRSSSQPP